MTGSWRTTGLGICAILSAVAGAAVALLDGDAATSIDYPAFIAAVTAGWGLIMARDKNVSSEQQGVK